KVFQCSDYILHAVYVLERHPESFWDVDMHIIHYVGNKVCRRHKIDVVASVYILDSEHNVRQFFVGNRPAVAVIADLIVLAIDASHIAIAEKDRARTSGPNQHLFFAEMGPVTGDDRFVTGPAKTTLLGPVHAALMGTQMTIGVMLFRFLYPLFQFAVFIHLDITR